MEQDAGRSRGGNKNDKDDKEESKNYGYATGSTNFDEAPDWNNTDASIPHD